MKIISYGHIKPVEIFCNWCGAMLECTRADVQKFPYQSQRSFIKCPVCGKLITGERVKEVEGRD